MKNHYEYSDRLNAPLEAFCHHSTPSNFPILPHWHYFIEIIYLIQGDVLASCEDHVYALHPGDLIFFPPQKLHTIDLLPQEDQKKHGLLLNRSANDCRLMQQEPDPVINPEHGSIHPVPKRDGINANVQYYVLKFDLNFLRETGSSKRKFSKIFQFAYNYNPACIFFSANALHNLPIRTIMRDCIQEMNMRNYGYDTVVCSLISTMLTYFIRRWLHHGLDLDEIILAPAESQNTFDHITEYIEAHFNEPLRIQDLAEHCGMSYSYFAKLFRETYNQSCKEYIEFIRINKVIDLLLFTNLDLNYISQETGFADCSHLIRTFKKWKGTTPKQWKKTYSNPSLHETLF